MIIDAQFHFGNLKLSEIVIYFVSVISIKPQTEPRTPLFWACAVEQVRQSLWCSTMPNVSISRCAYASFSQNAYLLGSFINITQGSNLLPGIINRSKSRLFS